MGDVLDRGELADRLATILDVNKRLALGPDLGDILPRITEEAARLLEADAAGLRLVDGHELVRAASFGPADAIMVRWRLPIGQSLSGRVAAEDRPILSADVSNDPRHDPLHQVQARARGLRCWLGVPLRGRHGVVGVLFVVSRQADRRFSRSEVGLLEAFADQAAIAVENSRVLRQEQERRRQLDTLRGLTSTLVNTVAVEELAQRIVDAVPGAFGQDARFIGGAIATVDDERHSIRAHAMTTLPVSPRVLALVGRPFQSLEQPIDASTNLLHEVVVSGEGREGDRLADFVAPTIPSVAAGLIERLVGIRGVVTQPITVHGRTLGAFLFALAKPAAAVTAAERELIADFATTAGIALENVRLYAASERRTLTDALTGIANRRHFDRKLAEEVAVAVRDSAALTLLLVDIDDFKAYNDAHGHQAGDATLRGVAGLLRRSIRSTDFVARYGGEEFAILLPGSDAAGAQAVGEEVRRAVAASALGVTISVGGAVRPVAGAAGGDTLIAAADAALYAAKRAGRNRAVVLSS